MKYQTRYVIAALALAFVVLVPAQASETSVLATGLETSEVTASITPAAEIAGGQMTCPFGQTRKIVKVRCRHGARGAAVGEYGGVPISLFCYEDSSSVEVCASDEIWAFRMSSDSGSLSVDCFFNGNSGRLREVCDAVTVSAR